jgi:hypothetical protein
MRWAVALNRIGHSLSTTVILDRVKFRPKRLPNI